MEQQTDPRPDNADNAQDPQPLGSPESAPRPPALALNSDANESPDTQGATEEKKKEGDPEQRESQEDTADSERQVIEDATASAPKPPVANAQVSRDNEWREFNSPRPVSDYLKDDDGIPGWAWTAGGVTLIATLDELDKNWNDEDDRNTPRANRAPQFQRESLDLGEIEEDNAITFTVNVRDRDGDTITFSTGDPNSGTVTEGDTFGEFIYTPDANFNGEDSFTIVASDPSSALDTLTVSVNVTPVEDEPTAEAEQNLATEPDQPLEINVGADDGDGDELTYTLAEGERGAQHGSVTLGAEDGSYIYTPNQGFVGRDEFDIVISDGKAEITQTVSILVANSLALSGDDASVNEADEGSHPVTLTLNLDEAPTAEDLVLNVSQTGGDAEEGIDFGELPDTVTIPVGETSTGLVINVFGDTDFEGDETLVLTLSNPLLDAPLEIVTTIVNDDPGVGLRLAPGDDSGLLNNDGITNERSPTLQVSAKTGVEVAIFNGEQLMGTAEESSDQPGRYSLNLDNLSDGDYQFTAVVSENGSESDSSAPLNITIDTASPILTGASSSSATDAVTLSFSENVAIADLSAILFTIDDAQVDILNSVVDQTEAVFTLDADLTSGLDIGYSIGNGAIQDIAGNNVQAVDG